MILHIVNLTNEGTWRGPIDELIPVGPINVSVRLSDGVRGGRARLLVSDTASSATPDAGWVEVRIPLLIDHEVIVLE